MENILHNQMLEDSALNKKGEFNMAKNLKDQLQAKVNSEAVEKKPKTIMEWIKAMEPEIKRALPKHITTERITRIALTAVRMNPQLGSCEPVSLMAAIMQSAQLGLEPNTPLGQAYIIPYGKEAQFQVGYKGLIELAHRANLKNLYARTVYSNDEFEVNYGLHQDIKHKPTLGERGEAIGYYAVYHLQSGGYGFEFMSRREIEEHKKKYSKAASSKYSPWVTDFDSMAKKTVIKRALKYAPISVEIVKGMAADETVKKEINEDMSIIPDVSEHNVFDAEIIEVKGEEVNEKHDNK